MFAKNLTKQAYNGEWLQQGRQPVNTYGENYQAYTGYAPQQQQGGISNQMLAMAAAMGAFNQGGNKSGAPKLTRANKNYANVRQATEKLKRNGYEVTEANLKKYFPEVMRQYKSFSKELDRAARPGFLNLGNPTGKMSRKLTESLVDSVLARGNPNDIANLTTLAQVQSDRFGEEDSDILKYIKSKDKSYFTPNEATNVIGQWDDIGRWIERRNIFGNPITNRLMERSSQIEEGVVPEQLVGNVGDRTRKVNTTINWAEDELANVKMITDNASEWMKKLREIKPEHRNFKSTVITAAELAGLSDLQLVAPKVQQLGESARVTGQSVADAARNVIPTAKSVLRKPTPVPSPVPSPQVLDGIYNQNAELSSQIAELSKTKGTQQDIQTLRARQNALTSKYRTMQPKPVKPVFTQPPRVGPVRHTAPTTGPISKPSGGFARMLSQPWAVNKNQPYLTTTSPWQNKK